MKIFKILLVFFCCLISINVAEAEEFNITANNVVLYNLNDDNIIYKKNSTDRVQIASLTKIMTAYVGIVNNNDLNKQVEITKEMFSGISEYSQVGFKVGDKVSVMDLLYGIMLPSGADAVNALMISTSGSTSNFVKLMNDTVAELGL